MQTLDTYAVFGAETAAPVPGNPARPEPFINERVAAATVVQTMTAPHAHAGGADAREILAEAFMSLGRGVDAKAAYERAKDFYRSGGHDWTRGLR